VMPPIPSNKERPPDALLGTPAGGHAASGPETLGEALRDPTPTSRVCGVLSAMSVIWGGRAWWGAVALICGLTAIVVTELIRVRKAVRSIESPPAT